MDEFWKAIGAGLPAAIAFVGIYVAASKTLRNQREVAVRAAREDAYSSITASKFTFAQALVTHLETDAHFQYHSRKAELQPEDSRQAAEALRCLHRLDGSRADAAKELGGLARAIGRARVAFPRSDELEKRFAAVVDDYRAPRVPHIPASTDLAALERWHSEGIDVRTTFVDREYTEHIRELLRSLREHMNDPIG